VDLLLCFDAHCDLNLGELDGVFEVVVDCGDGVGLVQGVRQYSSQLCRLCHLFLTCVCARARTCVCVCVCVCVCECVSVREREVGR
jgi:hypothetical protein